MIMIPKNTDPCLVRKWVNLLLPPVGVPLALDPALVVPLLAVLLLVLLLLLRP